MPEIYVRNSGRHHDASPARSILNNLLEGGEPIAHVCGGKAQCGTCAVRIEKGGAGMNPRTDREKKKLAALGDPPGMRLACQAHALRDVELVVLNPQPPR